MYKTISRLLPKKTRENYTSLLKYCNIKADPESFIGFVLIFGIGLAIAVGFLLASKLNLPLWLMAILIFVIFEVSIYLWLVLKADKKTKFIEFILPDALQIMSSNLRAGMTTDHALLLAARDEFGEFKDELSIVGKQVAMGKELDRALLDMTKRIRSNKLEKSIILIVSGIKSGGQLAELLDQTASNLRNQKVLEEKVRSNVLMYIIFIFVAVGIGAPLLFGLSSYLVEVLTKNLANVDIPQTSEMASMNLPFTVTKIAITSGFVIQYAIISLLTSSILGALIIGLIYKGETKDGVRYIPILVALSLGTFFIVRFIVGKFLMGFFGI